MYRRKPERIRDVSARQRHSQPFDIHTRRANKPAVKLQKQVPDTLAGRTSPDPDDLFAQDGFFLNRGPPEGGRQARRGLQHVNEHIRRDDEDLALGDGCERMISLQVGQRLQIEHVARQHEIDDLPAPVLEKSVTDCPAFLDDEHVSDFITRLNQVITGQENLLLMVELVERQPLILAEGHILTKPLLENTH